MTRATGAGLAISAGVLGRGVGVATAAPFQRAAQTEATTLTIALNGSPSDLDPHSAYDYRSAFPLRGPYEQLIALDGTSTTEYVGKLAEEWSANEDQSVWTFSLRDGVTFHDGTPCDATAVKASFDRFITLGMGPAGAMARFVVDLGQITAPDARTVVFDLGRPQPLFEAYMTSQYGPVVMNTAAVMAEEIEGDLGHFWAQTNAAGLGTGPYQIVEFLPEERVVLERFDGYWGGWEGTHFDQIVIRIVSESESRRQLIERGEVDVVDNLTPEALQSLEGNPDVFVDRSYSAEVDYVMLTVDGVLATPEARRAMCFAFPYDEVIDGVYRGYAKRAIGGVAELLNGFNPETPTYETDLAQAKELFAAAGVPEGTTITLTQESGDENVKAAMQLFAANLAEIGITLAIETVDLTTFSGIVFGDAPVEERPQAMPWFWWPDYNDALNHLYPQISCTQWGSKGTNSGFYCNQEVEELLDAAFAETDQARYQEQLNEIQRIISGEDPPAVYYMQREWTTVVRTGIEGFYFNPINIGTLDFYGMSRETG